MDPSQYRNDKLMDSLGLRARRLASLFSIFMTLVFVLAVIIYAAVRGNQALNSPAASVLTNSRVSAMVLPALTVCPMFPQASITPTECVFEHGMTVVDTCLSHVLHVTVSIEGVPLSCLQYNNPSSGQPYVATGPDSELGTRTLVDFTKVPIGEPLGVFVMVHAQSIAPPFNWNNVFVGDPGDVMVVLLQNTTLVKASGASSVDFSVSVSKAATAANDTTSMNTVDIDLIYPQMISYYDTEVPIYIQHNWVGEVGGLSALLYFLHITIMWVILVTLGCCGCRTTQKGMSYQVDETA